ncbi:endonuclease 2-like [Salvia divinorum]|uniref:Aspergillus nuclease S1 n=1 Tax=Salvia divinorum TaxID=28513 RepID=A0ABD1HM87_SALDI
MEKGKLFHILMIPFSLTLSTPCAHGWGYDGHTAICRIAQDAGANHESARRVEKQTAASRVELVKQNAALRAEFEKQNAELCAEFENQNAELCAEFEYQNAELCAEFENQVLEQLKNLRDIHQPLHVGFTSDQGGNSNTIKVKWFNKFTELHHLENGAKSYAENIDAFITEIQQKINGQWGKQLKGWENCKTTYPNVWHAAESTKAACEWAYKEVRSGSVLAADYFKTRLPVVELRMAQAPLNRDTCFK